MNILVFGDSIATGKWDKKGGWVVRLWTWIIEKSMTEPNFEADLYNLSVSGGTVDGLLDRFDSEIEARLSTTGKTYVIFSIGVNDSQYLNNKDRVRFKDKQFRQNVETLLTRARRFTADITFLGFLPVDESKVDPKPWAIEESYKNKYIKRFNSIIAEVCAKKNVDFINVYDRFKKKDDYKELLDDGVHPTTAGHRKIYKIVKEKLKNKLT
jgi:lysophospholipase L1-like esterase